MEREHRDVKWRSHKVSNQKIVAYPRGTVKLSRDWGKRDSPVQLAQTSSQVLEAGEIVHRQKIVDEGEGFLQTLGQRFIALHRYQRV